MIQPLLSQATISTLHIQSNSTIIVGFSGGPDSMYLLYQLNQLKSKFNIKIIAAYLDHEWQESSKIAAQTCRDSCDELSIPLIIKKLSELKFESKWNGSQEELGRKMRRHLFESLAQEYQATAIALAHHQQDQQETFFIRLLRGSSLTGLTGIKEKDGMYIRPILHCSKNDILHYLDQNKIAYYTDPTNCSDDYLRNRIRNHVVPALQLADNRFDKNIISTMNHLTQVDDFLNQEVIQSLTKISTDQGIEIQPFLQLHIVVQQRLLLHTMITEKVIFTPSQKLLKEIVRFLTTSSSKTHTIHSSWVVQKNKSHFSIKKITKIY